MEETSPIDLIWEVHERYHREMRARAEVIRICRMVIDPQTGRWVYLPSPSRPPPPPPDPTGWGPNAWGVQGRYHFEGNPKGFLVNYPCSFPHF